MDVKRWFHSGKESHHVCECARLIMFYCFHAMAIEFSRLFENGPVFISALHRWTNPIRNRCQSNHVIIYIIPLQLSDWKCAASKHRLNEKKKIKSIGGCKRPSAAGCDSCFRNVLWGFASFLAHTCIPCNKPITGGAYTGALQTQ